MSYCSPFPICWNINNPIVLKEIECTVTWTAKVGDTKVGRGNLLNRS